MLLFDVIRNIITYGLSLVTILIVLIPVLILVHLPFSWPWVSASFYKTMHTLHWLFLSFTFLPVTLNYQDKLLPKTAIFVANHESSLDIFMMGRVLKDRKYTMLAKGELLSYPILGTLFKKIGVPVYFDDSSNRGKALPLAIEKLNDGISVGLFPESSRFIDGKIHLFKTGFSVMAQQSGKPVVPVFLKGAGKALPPGHKLIKWYPLQITVGEPFYFKKDETVKEFTQRVRSWFIEKNKTESKIYY